MVPSPGMGLGRRGHLGQGGKDSDIVRVKHQALVVSHIVFIRMWSTTPFKCGAFSDTPTKAQVGGGG